MLSVPCDLNIEKVCSNSVAEKRLECFENFEPVFFSFLPDPYRLKKIKNKIRSSKQTEERSSFVLFSSLSRLACLECVFCFYDCGSPGTPVGPFDCFCADKRTEINKLSGDFKAAFGSQNNQLME